MSLISSNTAAAKALGMMIDDVDSFLRQVFVPLSGNVQFQVEGVLFHAKYSASNNGIKLLFWAKLGYLPFSVESAVRRNILITVLESVRYRSNAIFGINDENEIIVSQSVDVPSIQPPSYIFVPLVAFLQEALPTIRLIGECLQE